MKKIDSEIKSKFVNDKHRFVTNLVLTANWLQNTFNEYLKPYGISVQQYDILRILRGLGDWTRMSDIKDGLMEKSPNTTRLADKLINKELIERKTGDEDRRVVQVRITPKGLDLFEEIDKTESLILKALRENITDEEARYVSDVLDKFRM